jgi:acetate kinase
VRLLTVNAGSTSMKISLVEIGGAVTRYASVDDVLADGPELQGVVHRVVHGGDRAAPVVLDDGVLAELAALTELAPLHQPPALDAVETCRAAWPDIPQVACFDTAFHTTIPLAARTYALPAELRRDVRVYGFHGLSHAWSVARVTAIAPDARRIVVAHLGGGHSLCGAIDGRSVTTTMGFTPLDGLVMPTRSGSLDPGAVLWMSSHVDDLADVLAHRSGLLGLSGTADLRELLERDDEEARFALDVYLHRFVSLLGGCVATLHGLDALVFTGGAGEHSATLRTHVADQLAWLGVAIDPKREGEEITASGAGVRTFVVESREDLQMAAEARHLVRPT